MSDLTARNLEKRLDALEKRIKSDSAFDDITRATLLAKLALTRVELAIAVLRS